MAMLKTITPKSVSAVGAAAAGRGVSSYLTGASERRRCHGRLLSMSRYLALGGVGTSRRIICFAHSDNIMCDEERGWEREFVETKTAWGKLEGIPYYHFVISPDPSDRVPAHECLDLARDWVERCYPGSQWFAAIHDDNANHITHAHVIVNSVLPDSGKKIHRSKSDISREARTLSKLCVEHELTPMMDNDRRRALVRERGEGYAHLAATSSELAERSIVARGARSYKAEIRASVDSAARGSHSWLEFIFALDRDGIDVKATRKGITYILRDWDGRGTRRVPASRLGNAYTREGVLDRLGVSFDAVLGMKVRAWGVPITSPRRPPHFAAVIVSRPRCRPRARHRSADGMIRYRTLSELLGARVSSAPGKREVEDIVETARFLQREGIRSREELARRADETSEALWQAEVRLDENTQAGIRLLKVMDRLDEADSMREELKKLEGRKAWLPKERAARRDLRERIETAEGWVADQLDEAELWAEAHGIDPSTSRRTVVMGMLSELRADRPNATAAVSRLRGERDDLARAAHVIYALDGERRDIGDRGARVPHWKGAVDLGATRRGMELSAEERRRYEPRDWQRLASMVASQIGDSRDIAAASELLREDERIRRAQSDAWLASLGIELLASVEPDVDHAPRMTQGPGMGRTQGRADDAPQQ